MGWGSVAAFTAQFCAFGGKVDQVWTPAYSATGQPLGQVPKSVDGVAMFEDYGLVVPAGFLQAYVNRHPDAPRSLLMSLWYYPPTDAQALGPLWPKLRGVVEHISGIANPAEPAWRTYHAAYHRAFPGNPVEFATESDVLPFRNAMAAVLQAIETVNGDLGNHPRPADGRVGPAPPDHPVRCGEARPKPSGCDRQYAGQDRGRLERRPDRSPRDDGLGGRPEPGRCAPPSTIHRVWRRCLA